MYDPHNFSSYIHHFNPQFKYIFSGLSPSLLLSSAKNCKDHTHSKEQLKITLLPRGVSLFLYKYWQRTLVDRYRKIPKLISVSAVLVVTAAVRYTNYTTGQPSSAWVRLHGKSFSVWAASARFLMLFTVFTSRVTYYFWPFIFRHTSDSKVLPTENKFQEINKYYQLTARVQITTSAFTLENLVGSKQYWPALW